jgi:hypothetical protein
MRYIADLAQLSMELKKKSSNLEQYICGTDPGRSARWNEMIFLLGVCHDALLPSTTDTNHSVRKSFPPDTKRIRGIESLLGSLLIDELSLDNRSAFESIYALRPLSQGTKPYTFDFKINTFEKLSSILGRVSAGTEYLSSWKDEQLSVRDTGSGRSRNLLALSSDLYLLYLALGEPADLKQMIECVRKLPEWRSFDSSKLLPAKEDTRRGSLPGHATRPISEDTFPFVDALNNILKLGQLTSYMRETGIIVSEQVRRDTITQICPI